MLGNEIHRITSRLRLLDPAYEDYRNSLDVLDRLVGLEELHSTNGSIFWLGIEVDKIVNTMSTMSQVSIDYRNVMTRLEKILNIDLIMKKLDRKAKSPSGGGR